MTVYLLHFNHKYHHAQHYLGYAWNLPRRLNEHRIGSGARLTQVIKEAGLKFTLVKVWEGDRKEERRMKNLKNARLLCPICRKKKLMERIILLTQVEAARKLKVSRQNLTYLISKGFVDVVTDKDGKNKILNNAKLRNHKKGKPSENERDLLEARIKELESENKELRKQIQNARVPVK